MLFRPPALDVGGLALDTDLDPEGFQRLDRPVGVVALKDALQGRRALGEAGEQEGPVGRAFGPRDPELGFDRPGRGVEGHPLNPF